MDSPDLLWYADKSIYKASLENDSYYAVAQANGPQMIVDGDEARQVEYFLILRDGVLRAVWRYRKLAAHARRRKR